MQLDRSPDTVCLFLDVDGSLIDIAPRPDAVVVPQALVADLQRATTALDGALALISGRSIAQLDALFSPARLRAGGVHGAEIRLDPDGVVTTSTDALIPDAVREDLHRLLARFPGTLLEDKAFSMAVHFRAVPFRQAAVTAALDALVARHPSADLILLPGHCVIEVKRPGFDKGSAVRRFLSHPPFAGRVPIFVGDDMTDRPGFAAAVAAGGQAYGVGRAIQGTTGTFADPSAVRRWVGAIANEEIMPA